MKERIITGVRIHHHRVGEMPRLVRFPAAMDNDGGAVRQPLDAARGIAIAFLASGVFWIALALIGS